MAEALRALHLERRPADERDVPAPSTLPTTRAAREALRLSSWTRHGRLPS